MADKIEFNFYINEIPKKKLYWYGRQGYENKEERDRARIKGEGIKMMRTLAEDIKWQ